MRTGLLGAVLVTLITPIPAFAQSDGPAHFTIGGGLAMPLSDLSERFRTGGAFNLGLIVEPTPVLGLQVEYGFQTLTGNERRIPLRVNPFAADTGTAVIESHHKVNFVVINAMVRTSGDDMFKPYALGGGGMYHRTVSLTTPDVGYTTYCDPYWYICYPTVVEVDRVIGDRSSWDPGINLGAGIAIRLGEAAALYIESRWHYTWGPTFTDQDGLEQRANGQFFPVTFGFKF
jgi:opacity protein-like surface antigen